MLLAGVRAATHGDNVDLIVPESVVQHFAERLYAAGIFSDVVYPLTERSPAVADIVFELSVTSSYDLHRISNLARDIAVGLSVLLLQPMLPTVYDLEVTLTARAITTEDMQETVLEGSARSHFESTWLRVPEKSVRQWHRETARRAIDALVARVADRHGARSRPGTHGP